MAKGAGKLALTPYQSGGDLHRGRYGEYIVSLDRRIPRITIDVLKQTTSYIDPAGGPII